MAYILIKFILSAAIIVAVSEISRRLPLWGGVLASLPLVSILAMIWLYVDTHDPARVIALSWNIFWLVLPSLLLFICLPMLLKTGMGFTVSLMLAIVAMLLGYGATMYLLALAGQRVT